LQEKIKLKIKNESPNSNPEYAKIGDSGMDLRAWLSEPITLKSLERKLIPTGIYIDLPSGCEAQVRSRSGCALKQALCVANTPGTVDEPYVGHVQIIAINLSKDDIIIENGDRIAQLVICPVYNSNYVDIVMVDEINKITERGTSGFGDSGNK